MRKDVFYMILRENGHPRGTVGMKHEGNIFRAVLTFCNRKDNFVKRTARIMTFSRLESNNETANVSDVFGLEEVYYAFKDQKNKLIRPEQTALIHANIDRFRTAFNCFLSDLKEAETMK
jgi:hypothetical protein